MGPSCCVIFKVYINNTGKKQNKLQHHTYIKFQMYNGKDQIASWVSCFSSDSALSPSVFAVACGDLRQGLGVYMCVCGSFSVSSTFAIPVSVGSSVSRKLWFKSKLPV